MVVRNSWDHHNGNLCAPAVKRGTLPNRTPCSGKVSEWAACDGVPCGQATLVVVPVALMGGVAVAVVEVVHVIAVGDGNVAAALAMLVSVILMNVVLGGLALVPVSLVLAVDVAIVYEVDVIAVRESDMSAAFAVGVLVVGVGSVSHNHESFLRRGVRE